MSVSLSARMGGAKHQNPSMTALTPAASCPSMMDRRAIHDGQLWSPPGPILRDVTGIALTSVKRVFLFPPRGPAGSFHRPGTHAVRILHILWDIADDRRARPGLWLGQPYTERDTFAGPARLPRDRFVASGKWIVGSAGPRSPTVGLSVTHQVG